MLRPIVSQRMDPKDREFFIFNFESEMDPGELINPATLAIEVSAAAAAIGVSVLTASPNQPVVNGGRVQFWVQVAEAFRESPIFNRGASVSIKMTFETDATPPRRLERTGRIRIVQL
jgi:hypothetical protein